MTSASYISRILKCIKNIQNKHDQQILGNQRTRIHSDIPSIPIIFQDQPTFLNRTSPIRENWIIGKLYFPLENLENEIQISDLTAILFFAPFPLA